jgi:tetratricopeptide (TPR) repeat protein
MRLRSALSVLTIFMFASASHADTGSSFAGNYLAGRTAGRIRDTVAATDFLNAALSDDPGNPVLTERLFQNQLATGNISKAESTAKEVVSFNSQHRMARVTLGLKEFRNRRYAEARSNFAEAAYTPVGELTSALLSAWSYAGEGAMGAALKELDKLDAQESFANFKALHAALITDYLGSNLRADAAYKKAYDLAGTSLRVVQAYGNFLERNGRAAEAQKIYQTFLTGSQRNVLVEQALNNAISGKKPDVFIATPGAGASEALFSLAAALNSDQTIDVAQSYAQMALSFNAEQPVTQSLLGDILTDMKSYEAAIAAFEKIPQSSPLRIYADTEIAINYQRLDKGKEAVDRLKSVLSKEPRNLDAWTSLGNIHRVSGNNAEAVIAYGKAAELLSPTGDGNWQLFYNRGVSYDHLKDFEKSEADFRKAMKISGDEPSVLNYLGYSLIDRGQKLDEAIAMVKKAVDLRPNDGYIVDSLGWAYYTIGDYDQAVGFLERAVDLNPGDAIIAEHLGDAYWHVGRKNEAGFQYQHAKDNQPEPQDLKRIEGKLKDGLIEPARAKTVETKPVVKQ